MQLECNHVPSGDRSVVMEKDVEKDRSPAVVRRKGGCRGVEGRGHVKEGNELAVEVHSETRSKKKARTLRTW